MPEVETEATNYVDHAWANCRAVDADYRWTVEDMTPGLIIGASDYASGYTGTFSFLLDMKRQARRGRLSAAQAKGVMNCMMADVRRERQAAQPTVTVDMGNVMTLFQRAGTQLRNPSITLNGVTLALMTRGSFPGTVRLTSGRWPDRQWLGRIETNGRLTRGRLMTDEMVTLIQELGENPVAAAQRYAALTGNCCFCNLTLTDERSTRAGYGPVCAGHYGLPWGDREVASTPRPVGRMRYNRSDRDDYFTTDADGHQSVVRVTPQVAALPGMTPLGMQAETLIRESEATVADIYREAGMEPPVVIHMCGECPAFGLCQEQGECRGGVVA